MNETVNSAVIKASALTKTYGSLKAVDSINLQVREGELFGLIGPDGAGKTTIFHMLGGILDPSSGELTVLSLPPRQARLQIGYLTQVFSLYPDLSVEENLHYASGLRNVPDKEFRARKDYYLKLMDLSGFSERAAGNLSGGMKQKLALCCALISRPKLLLLDEPTTGVDPVSRRDFWDVLSTISQEGVTIAVATPYLDEAERCTRIALIHKGTIRETGTPAQLKERLALHRLEVRGAPLDEVEQLIADSIAASKLVSDVQEFGDRLDVLAADPDTLENVLLSESATQGLPLSVVRQEPTLENVFALTIKKSEQIESPRSFPFVERQPVHDVAIQADNLSKDFGEFAAVKGVSISVAYGEIFGLLGANGAGKTTTIKMLCGLLEPSMGTMGLAGQSHDLRNAALRRKLGYMSQKFTLYEDLTVIENLQFYGGIYNVPLDLMRERIRWVLDTCNLDDSRNMLAGKLPGGFRQRLAFGATVLHQPEILFLDEPTSGVDPIARRQLWTLIGEFARKGTAVLVTTHFLEEAEHCHNLAFMDRGEIVASGPPNQIKQAQPGKLLEIRTANNQAALALLRQFLPRWQISIFGDSLHLTVESPAQEQEAIRHLQRSGISVETSRSVPFSLEDSFIGIVERNKDRGSAA